jgi:hypothetical protein
MGKVDVAAPDPMIFALRAIVDEAKRLGVMDDNEFGIKREAVKIALLVFAKDFEVARSRMIGGSVKCVVEGLGDREEILAPGNDVPAEGQPRSAARGMMRLSISATPPPTAVEFTISTGRPSNGRARMRSSSISPAPITAA